MVVGGMHGCGGHVWLWGACVVGGCMVAGEAGVHGCGGACVIVEGACVVAGGMHGCRGHVWLWGACMVAGGIHGGGGGHMKDMARYGQ